MAALFQAVSTNVPRGWRDDVARVENLLDELAERHGAADLARLVAIASLRRGAARDGPRGLAQALHRGIAAREELREAEGGTFSVEAARPFLGGISRQAVLERFKNGRLVGWRASRQNAVRLPVWQFTDSGLLPGLEETLALLRRDPDLDAWGIALFFLTPRPALDGRRPLDLLRDGRADRVREAALAHTAA